MAVASSPSKGARKAVPVTPTNVVVSDPIADLLARIRNATVARHGELRLPSSRLKLEVARVLKEEGYITDFGVERTPGTAGEVLRIIFKAAQPGNALSKSAITGLKRTSKPGLRVYARKTEMPRVLGGLGIAILSTSHGVMSGKQAQKAGLGGEVLAYIW